MARLRRSVEPPPSAPTQETQSGASVASASPFSIAIASSVLGSFGRVAAAAEQSGLALQRVGARVSIVGSPNRVGFGLGIRVPDDAPVARHVLSFLEPTRWRREGGASLLGVLTDPYGEIPQAWEIGLAHAERIFCPSEWLLEAAYGATNRPVDLLRFGVDTSIFTPSKRERGAKLRVLFFATDASNRRKALDLAMEAFKRAFPRRADVELIVRSTGSHNLRKDDERIRFEFGPLPPSKLVELYRSCDVLLHPSRAESFGFVPLEAMATGMPAIHSGATGMAAYMDLGLTVPTRPIPGIVGEWREPYLSALIERLQFVDREYDAVTARAYDDVHFIAERFSWDAMAASLLSFISL